MPLTMAQWADYNALADRDIWMRLAAVGVTPAGPWRKFMLPPTNVPGCPAPVLRRSTLVAQGSVAMPLGGTYSVLEDRPQGYTFALPNGGSTTATHTIVGMIHVNIWCGRAAFDRFFHMLPDTDSHLQHMTWLRQMRDACIAGNTIDVTTDQATHIENFYMHSYIEDMLPIGLPDRDWVVDLVLINPSAGTGGGVH